MDAKVILAKMEELACLKTERWFASVRENLVDQLAQVNFCFSYE